MIRLALREAVARAVVIVPGRLGATLMHRERFREPIKSVRRVRLLHFTTRCVTVVPKPH